MFRVINDLRRGEEIYTLCITMILYPVYIISEEASLKVAKITPLDTKRYGSPSGFDCFEKLDHAPAVSILEQTTPNFGAGATGYFIY